MSTEQQLQSNPDHDSKTNLPIPPELVEPGADAEEPGLAGKIKTLLIGKPRDLADHSVFTHISLVAFLAWVGLGADGLSSSCYGPSEAFEHLGQYGYLAIFLALATVATVFIISSCYSHIIEEFPSGGGGYLVASKLLGRNFGVVSGCALLVDYVLTITTSIAAAGDALFGLMPANTTIFGMTPTQLKIPLESGAIVLLIVMNLRGVKESVKALLPIFLLFIVTHVILIVGALVLHVGDAGERVTEISTQIQGGLDQQGLMGLFGVFLLAYSFGAGTYTGIEAVSNSMPVMREPRVRTAKKTMRYMAWSLALMAGGLMIAYLLLRIPPKVEGLEKTMNHRLADQFMEDIGLSGGSLGAIFVMVTMLCEGALLFVAAQAGFIDGPRVLANMAQDSYAPHWFGSLSERLSSQNGVLLMGCSALAALWYTGGATTTLVIMYSINVFITFLLSMIGMCRHWWQERGHNPIWRKRFVLFAGGGALCASILCINIYEKFTIGGWVTLVVTGVLVTISFLIHAYYNRVVARLKKLNDSLCNIEAPGAPTEVDPDPTQPTAAVLVGGYSGLGVHTVLNAIRFAPDHFKNVIFLSVGVVDSGNFKGADAVDDLKHHTETALGKYVDFARRLGLPSTSFMAIGTDAVEELEHLCREVVKKFPKSVIFAGQLIFQKDTWYQRLLHNQTANSLQRRLQWAGLPMVILPTRVRETAGPKISFFKRIWRRILRGVSGGS